MQRSLCVFAILLMQITGCVRSLPPEVPEFKAPAAKVAERMPPEPETHYDTLA